MGCTPSSQNLPIKSGFKFNSNLNEDENYLNLDWPNKDGEDKLLLPSGMIKLKSKNKTESNSVSFFFLSFFVIIFKKMMRS